MKWKISKSINLYASFKANILGITVDRLDVRDRVDGLDRLVDTDFQN